MPQLVTEEWMHELSWRRRSRFERSRRINATLYLTVLCLDRPYSFTHEGPSLAGTPEAFVPLCAHVEGDMSDSK